MSRPNSRGQAADQAAGGVVSRAVGMPEWLVGSAARRGQATFLDETQLVSLCLLVGHYEMLGMLINSVGVTPEPDAWRRGRPQLPSERHK